MENIYYARSANEQGQKETVFHHLSRASAANYCRDLWETAREDV